MFGLFWVNVNAHRLPTVLNKAKGRGSCNGLTVTRFHEVSTSSMHAHLVHVASTGCTYRTHHLGIATKSRKKRPKIYPLLPQNCSKNLTFSLKKTEPQKLLEISKNPIILTYWLACGDNSLELL